jgi:hypothetical protein
LRLIVALLGATIFAAAGGLIGSMNAGWLILETGANGAMPALGVGAALVVITFAWSTLNQRLHEAGGVGRAAQVLLTMGPALYVVSWLVEFAILGTLSLGFGLVCLAVAVTRFKLAPVADRVLIIVSAVGSLTWNTETVSAFFLVGVGLIWMILSIRLLKPAKPPTKPRRSCLSAC